MRPTRSSQRDMQSSGAHTLKSDHRRAYQSLDPAGGKKKAKKKKKKKKRRPMKSPESRLDAPDTFKPKRHAELRSPHAQERPPSSLSKPGSSRGKKKAKKKKKKKKAPNEIPREPAGCARHVQAKETCRAQEPTRSRATTVEPFKAWIQQGEKKKLCLRSAPTTMTHRSIPWFINVVRQTSARATSQHLALRRENRITNSSCLVTFGQHEVVVRKTHPHSGKAGEMRLSANEPEKKKTERAGDHGRASDFCWFVE